MFRQDAPTREPPNELSRATARPSKPQAVPRLAALYRASGLVHWHKLDSLLGGTFRGWQPRQFGTFLTQGRHSCIAANYPSFDHLVGCRKERRRHGEA